MPSQDEKRISLEMLKRECGSCQVCCQVLGVKELGKPYYTQCKSQCDKGCFTYKDRPYTCRVYECMYKVGILPKRPDEAGVLYDLEEDIQGDWLMVYEARDGGFESLRNSDVVQVIKTLRPITKIVGVRFHLYGNRIGCVFPISDDYPGNKDVSLRTRIYGTDDYYSFVYSCPGEPVNA